MTRTSAELMLLAVLVAAAWFAFGHGMRTPGAVDAVSARAAVPAGLDPIGGGLEERARHLRAYLAAPPTRGVVRRNLFSFPAPRRTPAPTVEQAAEPDPGVVETRPELTLSGIAEDSGPGGTVRTAVIAAAGQVLFAKEGDRVLSRFLVMRIAADAVQLKDTERGDVFTLAFR